MPIIEGSMNHTYSGRRRKRIIRSKKAKVQFFQISHTADNLGHLVIRYFLSIGRTQFKFFNLHLGM